MVKRNKSRNRHILLVSVFVLIIFLAVAAFLLQRSNIGFVGEALRQRVDETKQLALSPEEVEIAIARQHYEQNHFVKCPVNLMPATEQHWKLEGRWNFLPLKAVASSCDANRIVCYYADSEAETNRADQVVTYFEHPLVENCQEGKSGDYLGCDCAIK